MKLSKLRSKSFLVGSFLFALFSLSVGVVLSSSIADSYQVQAYYSPSSTYTNGDGATYYNGISSSATGTTLLSALQSLNSSKRQKTIGYSSMGTSASTSPYVYTDYNPNGTKLTDSNGQVYGTELASFYTKTAMTSYNKEHVWPDSRGGGSVDGDIHMPRPTISSENSNRGNSFYVEGMASSSNGWDPYTAGYGTVSRGEAARIIFYCVVANSSLSLSDSNTIASGATGYTTTMGKLSDMLSWNLEYATSIYEQNRNEGAEYLQGNRNPFVDHPEYACKIWGNTNSTTQQICSASSEAPNTITLTPSTSSIAVGGNVTLSATVDTGSSSVTWSTSNESIATVSNGVVTGVAAGTATITATSTVNTSIKGTSSITVKSLSSLSVSGTPTTTSYSAGQSFNPAGLTVTATYSDSSTTNVTSSVVWTPSPLTQGTTSVTGSYGGKTVNVSGLTVTTPVGYSLVTDTSQLAGGDSLIFAHKGSSSTAGALSSSYLTQITNATFSSDQNSITSPGSSLIFTLGGTSGAWTFSNGGSTLKCSAAKNVNFSSGTATWSISIVSSGDATVTSASSAYGTLQYNTGAPRFTTYTSGQAAIQIYHQASAPSSVAVTGVSIAPSTLNLIVGDTSNLTATIAPSNATNQSVSWSSDHSNFASVSNGTVTANAAGSATITVTTDDGGFSDTCSVTVIADTVTNVSITNSTTYHPGEAISKSDITVTLTYQSGGSGTTTDFAFANDGYQFTYADTNSGGSSKTKQFSIVYDGASYNFSVNVSRVAYQTVSGETNTLSSTEFNGSTVSKSSGTPSSTSVTIDSINFAVTTNAYVYSSCLSFGKAAGSINNVNAFESDLSSVSIAEKTSSRQDGVITISKNGTSWVAYSTAELANGGYRYFKVAYTGSSSLYSNIENITYTLSGQDSLINVANYIMYEDTVNQCTTKLDLAIDKLNSMSTTDKNTFWTASDYVISVTRERLIAWATHEGKQVIYDNGSFQVSNANNTSYMHESNQPNSAVLIGISLIIGLATLGGYTFLRHKKECVL